MLCALAALTGVAAGTPTVLSRQRTAGAGVYKGAPALDIAHALVTAGGGPGAFKTTTLIGALAGSNANADVAALVKKFGAADVKRAMATLDFVVADALRLAKQNALVLPSTLDSTDGRALSVTLYAAGAAPSTGRFSVDYLLDHLLTPALRRQIMHDVDATYGVQADTDFHRAVVQLVK